jgi:hypothetical protein
MKQKRKLMKFGVLALILHFMLIPNSKAQLALSQDPLYHLVFNGNFDSTGLDTSKWFTTWPWWGTNGAICNTVNSCSDPTWPVPYCRQWPNDTANRKYFKYSTGDSSFQRLVSKREFLNANVTEFGECPSGVCKYHKDTVDGNGCYLNSSNGNYYCSYDSSMQFKFSSAILLSHYSFTDGYFEIKYRLTNYDTSQYNAFGPNFWLWGGSSHRADSAAYSEIDIFEMEGQHWTMDANAHLRKQDSAWDPHPTHIGDTAFWNAKYADGTGNQTEPPFQPYANRYTGPYNNGQWHTVGCEWTPDHIDFYYDSNDTMRRYSDTKFPVHDLDSMFILVGTEMMPPNNYCISWDSLKSPKSINYDIAYVKAYQINQVGGCASQADSLPNGFTTNTYTSTLYKDVNIGGCSSCTAKLDSGSYHIAGQNFVLLQSGFEASGTATVIISTTPCQQKQTDAYNKATLNPVYNPQTLKDMQRAHQTNNE